MNAMRKPNASSSAKYIIEYAQTELGVELPKDLDKAGLLAEVRRLMQEAGTNPDPDDQDEEDNQQQNNHESQGGSSVAAEKPKKPSHYTIKVTRPNDTKLADMVINGNGDNYQIHFGKAVKVPAVVFNILNDARRLIPAHRDMETNELIPESWEHEYNFSVLEEHFS